MLAVLTHEMTPDSVHSALHASGIHWPENARLVMVGHRGNDMWDVMNRPGESHILADPDPVDRHSVECVRHFITNFLDDCPCQVLYPGSIPIPLQQLGAAANWHYSSPLGIGLHPRYGPWFGYRAVLLVTSELPVLIERAETAPCDGCDDKPCISTCPASALSADRLPDVSACVSFRTGTDRQPGALHTEKMNPPAAQGGAGKSPDSECALTCLARLACPVGAAHRYREPQIRYFYGRSLASIRKYLAAQPPTD